MDKDTDKPIDSIGEIHGMQISRGPITGRFSSQIPQIQSIPREMLPDLIEGEPVSFCGEYPPLTAEDLLPRSGGQNESK